VARIVNKPPSYVNAEYKFRVMAVLYARWRELWGSVSKNRAKKLADWVGST
jgi:hypothetical protein